MVSLIAFIGALTLYIGQAITINNIDWDVKFGWYFPTSSTITFYVYVDDSVLDDAEWGWFGVGIKAKDSAVSMTNADMVIINIDSETATSRTSTGNMYPAEDSNTMNSIISQSSGMDGSNVYFTWTRSLNTGITGDIVLVADTEYLFIFAHGAITSGAIQKHVHVDDEEIKLSYDTSATEINEQDSARILGIFGVFWILFN